MARLNEGRHNADACVAKLRPDVQEKMKSSEDTPNPKMEVSWPPGCRYPDQIGATPLYCEKLVGSGNYKDSNPNPPIPNHLCRTVADCYASGEYTKEDHGPACDSKDEIFTHVAFNGGIYAIDEDKVNMAYCKGEAACRWCNIF